MTIRMLLFVRMGLFILKIILYERYRTDIHKNEILYRIIKFYFEYESIPIKIELIFIAITNIIISMICFCYVYSKKSVGCLTRLTFQRTINNFHGFFLHRFSLNLTNFPFNISNLQQKFQRPVVGKECARKRNKQTIQKRLSTITNSNNPTNKYHKAMSASRRDGHKYHIQLTSHQVFLVSPVD